MPIGRGLAYVYSGTRVVSAVFGNYYACIVPQACSSSIGAVVNNYGASILTVYSTQHAIGGRNCIGTGVRGVPLRG